MRLPEFLWDLLYPPKCPFCGRVQDVRLTAPCPRCQPALPWTGAGEEKPVPGCDGCIAPLWYRDGVVEAVHRFKFRGGQDHAALLGALMSQCVGERLTVPPDVVTWAPLSPKRLRERGYDQARLLAAEVAARQYLPLVPMLEKVRDIPPQSGLEDGEARRRNVSGAYRALEGAECAGLHVLLVDDVITTGSTVGECAGVLRAQGAARVTALGLAWAGK